VRNNDSAASLGIQRENQTPLCSRIQPEAMDKKSRADRALIIPAEKFQQLSCHNPH